MYDIFAKIVSSENILKIIDRVHQEVHEGHTFNNSLSTTVIATSTYFITYVNSTAHYAHYQFYIYTSAAATVGLYESPTAASTWAATTSYNHHRGSTNAANLTVRNNVPSSDITSTGTLLETLSVGGGSNPATFIGGDIQSRQEWILNKGTTYLIKINSASTNTYTFASKWYEE